MTHHHRHWIIEQIIPTRVDCHAVYAWWPNNILQLYREVVPAFALVAECAIRKEDENYNPIGECHSNGLQKIVPCICDDVSDYVPSVNWQEPDNMRFLGLEYEISKEQPVSWIELATEAYQKAIKKGQIDNDK